MASWSKRILVGAAPLALAVAAGLGEARAASSDGCMLSPRTCAKEGFVIVGPTADQLVAWRKDTDFYQIRVGRAQRFLDRAGAEQTFTLLLSGEDLASGDFEALIEQVIARGGSVIVTQPSLADADLLNELTGLSGASWEDPEPGLLYGVRTPFDDDGRTHEMAFMLFTDDEIRRSCRACLSDNETEWLTTRIGPNPPVTQRDPSLTADSLCDQDPQSCINKLALAKHTSTKDTNNKDSFEVDNFIYSTRSFLNEQDLYYVEQELQFTRGSCSSSNIAGAEMRIGIVQNTPALAIGSVIQPSPGSTQPTTTVTSGVNFGIGGQGGYLNGIQIFNVAPSIAFSNSTTTTVPSTQVTNDTDLDTGVTDWAFGTLQTAAGSDDVYNTFWIWEVALSTYQTNEETLSFNSDVTMETRFCNPGNGFSKTLQSQVDQPFPTPMIDTPVVGGITGSPVPAGQPFEINGSGFYPSLVESVLLGGNAVPAANVTTTSDKLITVIAPNNPSNFPFNRALSVTVTTSAGASNSDQTVTITRN